MLDDTDRRIIEALQGDFPLASRPFALAGKALGISEKELIIRLDTLLQTKVLTRFGPMFNIDRMGGKFCLCAMAVPAERFEIVAGIVNAFPEVAHNYEREHAFNMWFVLAAEKPEDIARLCSQITAATGIEVLAFPKEREFFVELKVPA